MTMPLPGSLVRVCIFHSRLTSKKGAVYIDEFGLLLRARRTMPSRCRVTFVTDKGVLHENWPIDEEDGDCVNVLSDAGEML